MKKNIFILLAAVILMTSCGTYAGSGAANGAYFGSMLGSAIGGLNAGYRGHYRGQLIGMATGALVGAAVGDAKDKAVARDRRQYLEEKARLKANRDARKQNAQMQTQYQDNGMNYSEDPTDAGYDANGSYDDRIDIDFGDGTSSSTGSTFTEVQTEKPNLIVRNAYFEDENGDGVLSRGETAEISFEIFNSGNGAAYNVEPVVFEQSKNKHILISPTILVESLGAKRGIRYTARIVADRSMKPGTAVFKANIRVQGQSVAASNSIQVSLRK